MSAGGNGGLRKRRRTADFVQIASRTVRDSEISFRARGILAWILDHPDGWDVRSEVIAREGTEGREAVRTALAELAARGYYRVERRRQPDGQVLTVTVVSEIAVQSWAEEYTADQAGAGTRKDGKTPARRRSPLYVQDDGGEWVRAPHELPAKPSGPMPTEDGFSGSGSPGSGSPGAGNLGSLVQRETQIVTTTRATVADPDSQPARLGADDLARVVVDNLPDPWRTGISDGPVRTACNRLAADGWTVEHLAAATRHRSWAGAHGPGAVVAWLRGLPAPPPTNPPAPAPRPHCGDCDLESRWEETPEGWRRCPRCNADSDRAAA